MQKVYFYFDDSGVLHKNANNKYFIYAGYAFLSVEPKEKATRKYRAVHHDIKTSLQIDGELKACILERKHKRALYNVMKNEYSFSVAVDTNRVYDSILSSKKSIHRYKDYILKRTVKDQLKHFIREELISADEDICIVVNVDEQATATDGFYQLEESIFEELKKGIHNFDYGTFHTPLFNANVSVNVQYCDSSKYYLIQASDILANRIWTSYITGKRELRDIPNHLFLHSP